MSTNSNSLNRGSFPISLFMIWSQALYLIVAPLFISTIAINPTGQVSSARDASRLAAVTQIGHATEAYYIVNEGRYPDEANWSQTLTESGEISQIPDGVPYDRSSPCTTNVAGGSLPTYCYRSDSKDVVIYAVLESSNYVEKCSGGKTAFTVYSSADGRGGVVCSFPEPSPGIQKFIN